jgi:hypothetical protein
MLLCIAALVVVVVIGLPESNRSVLRPGRKKFPGRRIAQTPNGAVLKERQQQSQRVGKRELWMRVTRTESENTIVVHHS